MFLVVYDDFWVVLVFLKWVINLSSFVFLFWVVFLVVFRLYWFCNIYVGFMFYMVYDKIVLGHFWVIFVWFWFCRNYGWFLFLSCFYVLSIFMFLWNYVFFQKMHFRAIFQKTRFFIFGHFWFVRRKSCFAFSGSRFWDTFGVKFIEKFIDFWGPKKWVSGSKKCPKSDQKVVRNRNRVPKPKLKKWVDVRVFQFPSQKEA